MVGWAEEGAIQALLRAWCFDAYSDLWTDYSTQQCSSAGYMRGEMVLAVVSDRLLLSEQGRRYLKPRRLVPPRSLQARLSCDPMALPSALKFPVIQTTNWIIVGSRARSQRHHDHKEDRDL